MSIVVQYDGVRTLPFARDLLFMSIYESCRHRANAVEDASNLTHTVINKLIARIEHATLAVGTITEVCAMTLQAFDSTAETIYSAYHVKKKH